MEKGLEDRGGGEIEERTRAERVGREGKREGKREKERKKEMSKKRRRKGGGGRRLEWSEKKGGRSCKKGNFLKRKAARGRLSLSPESGREKKKRACEQERSRSEEKNKKCGTGDAEWGCEH
jgi:hypothetical protein